MTINLAAEALAGLITLASAWVFCGVLLCAVIVFFCPDQTIRKWPLRMIPLIVIKIIFAWPRHFGIFLDAAVKTWNDPETWKKRR